MSESKIEFDLFGKTFVVTGASSGIGASTALLLARRGANLILHGRAFSPKMESVTQRLHEAAAPFKNATQPRFDHLFGDFSVNKNWSESDWDDFVKPVWDKFGSIDGWVNNAGGDVLTGDWKDRRLDEKLKYLWQVDVVSTLMLSRVVGRRMTEQPSGGCIVNIGWDQAANGMAGDSGELFSTTKGAIMSMSKSLAQSLAPNVRVNCVAPGWIKTQWGNETSDYWDQRAQTESLSNRWGTPEDVAQVIGFLCSDASQFLTGQTLPVNGGFRFNQV